MERLDSIEKIVKHIKAGIRPAQNYGARMKAFNEADELLKFITDNEPNIDQLYCHIIQNPPSPGAVVFLAQLAHKQGITKAQKGLANGRQKGGKATSEKSKSKKENLEKAILDYIKNHPGHTYNSNEQLKKFLKDRNLDQGYADSTLDKYIARNMAKIRAQN